MEGDNEMLSIAEVGRELGISRASAYQLIQHGKLVYYRVGPRQGVIRVQRADLRKYLEMCRVAPVEPALRVSRKALRHLRL